MHVMSAARDRRLPVVLAVLLCVLALGLRALLARQVQFCGTPDACYYLSLGQSLAAGKGFQARFLFDYQQAHPALPNTGLEYWRPGVSLLLLLLKPLGGVTLRGGVMLAALTGVLFAAAAWHIARRAGQSRWIALGALALCLFLEPTWIGSLSPDSGVFYGVCVAWFLALLTVRWQGYGADLAALGCVALAYLIRNDLAVLLLLPLLAVLWLRRRESAIKARTAPGWWTWAMLGGFFLALVPMHVVYWRVLGTAFPAGTARVLFLWDLGDFSRYGEPVSLHTLLAHGATGLIAQRVTTLATVLYRVGALMLGFPALLFLPVLLMRDSRDGAAARTRLPEWVGPALFAAVALAVYALVLPAIGGFSALRTAMGLLPLLCVLVVLAIARAARTPRLAAVLVCGVVGANAVSGLMESRRVLADGNAIAANDRAEAGALRALGADPRRAVVLTGDPVQFSATTGFAAVALPGNGLRAMAAAARDFGVTHVILDSNALPAPLPELRSRFGAVGATELAGEHRLILELRAVAAKRCGGPCGSW